MRTTRALYNFITDFIPLIIIALIGFLKLKLINENLGFAMSGMNTLFVNIMTYLSIMDGGMAGAVLYRLYKPIADEDHEKTSRVISAGRVLFNSIGFLILGLGIIISFVVFYLFKQDPVTISYSTVQFAFIIYLISSVIPYFVVVNKALFEASQKKYVTNIVLQSFTILKSLGEIFLLVQGYGLIEMYIMLILINLGSSIIIYFLSKKEFRHINFRHPDKDFEMKNDIKSLFVHKIGTTVAYNVDAVIIGSMIGIASVPFYTAYQYITDNLMTMIGKITYSITAGIGDLVARDRKRSYEVFKELNAMCFYLASLVCVALFLVINAFINIWQPLIETSTMLAFCFVMQLFYYMIRMPLTTYCNAAGLFSQTKICPIIESIVNIVLSLVLVTRLGIPGVLIATIIAYLVSDYFIRPVIIYKEIFNENVREYYLRNTVNFIAMLMSGWLCSHLIGYLNFDGYIMWFISSVIIFMVNMVMMSVYYILTKQASFFMRIVRLIRR